MYSYILFTTHYTYIFNIKVSFFRLQYSRVTKAIFKTYRYIDLQYFMIKYENVVKTSKYSVLLREIPAAEMTKHCCQRLILTPK